MAINKQSSCDWLKNECRIWFNWIWSKVDDWRHPRCPECGLKKN